MKYGHIRNTGTKNSLPTPIVKLGSESKIVTMLISHRKEETMDEINPEVAWAHLRFRLNTM